MSTRPGNKKIRRIDKNIIYNKYYMENNKQENKKKTKQIGISHQNQKNQKKTLVKSKIHNLFTINELS